MAEVIVIEVATAAEGYDLMRALGARGLPASLGEEDGCVEVRLDFRHEATELLLLDLLPALEGWRLDHDLGPVPLRVGEHPYPAAAAADPSRQAAPREGAAPLVPGRPA
jgi:hypothetical protein